MELVSSEDIVDQVFEVTAEIPDPLINKRGLKVGVVNDTLSLLFGVVGIKGSDQTSHSMILTMLHVPVEKLSVKTFISFTIFLGSQSGK